MKYCLFDHKTKLADYLSEFRSLPLSFEKIEELPQKKFTTFVYSPISNLQEYDFSFLFRYEIFPLEILNFFGEWQLHNREMQVGDIIIQQAKIPPVSLSIKLIFGVKILSVYHDKNKVGFSYGTLEGHPETGINEFSFFIKDDSLFAEVNTIAKPGLFLSQSLAFIFTKPYVNYCNQKALSIMKETFLSSLNNIIPQGFGLTHLDSAKLPRLNDLKSPNINNMG